MSKFNMFPVFITRAEFSSIFGTKKTKTYELINERKLRKAKVGRRTFISFASAIEFALSSLREGNGTGVLGEIFCENTSLENWEIAEALLTRLYNIHSSANVLEGGSIDTTLRNVDKTQQNIGDHSSVGAGNLLRGAEIEGEV